MWKMKILVVSVVILSSFNLAYARFGVQLPFLDGHAYECKQNSNDRPSHDISQTRYDLDFGMPRGTLLVAASGGKVIAVENNCKEGNSSCGHGFGNYVKIKNYNEDHSLLYAHLQYHGVIVSVGDDVNAGQPIGFSGNTGHSTGSHIHFGLHDINATRPGESKSNIEIWSHDNTTNQDIWRRVDVPRNDSTAFVCEQSRANGDSIDAPGHYYKAMDINGFNFSAFQCADLGNNSAHCWRGEKDSTGRYHSARCDEANWHVKYYKDSSGYHSQELSSYEGVDLCDNNQGTIDLITYLSGNYGIGGGGFPAESGNKTDLTPDFDIYNEQGQEISANSDNYTLKTVYVGQRIRLNLTTEVHNDDTQNHLRDSNSDSIEGPVYYWIDGVVNKAHTQNHKYAILKNNT